MERKLIISREGSKIVTTLFENGRAAEIGIYDEAEKSLLGNIYIGRVKNIAKHIGAAFIEIDKGLVCYYPLNECEYPIYTRKLNSPNMVAGDELLVQVNREAVKTKPPTLTTNLNFTGKYMVLTTGRKHIGVSTKIGTADRERLRKLFQNQEVGAYGFIVRTNAREASDSEIIAEMNYLISKCNDLIERAKYLSCFSVLSETQAPWLASLRDTNTEGLVSITTDDPALYAQMNTYMEEHHPGDLYRLVFYEDPLLPLGKLYNISGLIENALKERVWLKSGAYLVIQPTEALTVIDVNSGKYEGNKKKQDTFLKINLEAAAEIARQLRLRNISGIIIVDFINLDSQEQKQELLDQLNGYFKRDPIKTVLVGMTSLNLVEITRQKKRKPLAEQNKSS